MKFIFVVLVIGISIVIGLAVIELSLNIPNDLVGNQKKLNSQKYLKAATYFGEEWAINFWSSDFSTTDQNMERIKKDGFNTIVLIIPWGEFQPGISPIKYNDIAFERLNYILEKANSHGLDVVLRISYFWDYYPGVELPTIQRFLSLDDEEVYNAWLDYVHQIYVEVKNFKNVKLAFISWEDFWPFIENAMHITNVDERIALAQKIGFSDYLKSRYDLDYVSKIYGHDYKSWEKVPTPLSNSPAFELLFQFYDDKLVEKFLKPAQVQYPNLSMEVRVDKDPIQYHDGTVKWYSHSSTYNITGSTHTTIYYTQAIGAQNNYDYQSAKDTLLLLDHTLYNVKKYTDKNKLFVDQFIWFDNTPGFEKNTKIYENEIDSFLHGSCIFLKKYTSGYGIWTYRNYFENIVYNPSFSVGTVGWLTNGKTNLHENALILEQGSSVSQKIPQRFAHLVDTPVTMQFFAKANSLTADMSIEIGDKRYTKHVTDSDSIHVLQLPMNDLNNRNISFEVLNGSITLTDVKVYNHVQNGNIYNIDWEPLESLNSIHQLNQCLS